MIHSYGSDKKGRRLSWKAGVEQVGFEVFPEGCDGGVISYLEGERVPKNRDIVRGCYILYFWKRCRSELIHLGKLLDRGLGFCM